VVRTVRALGGETERVARKPFAARHTFRRTTCATGKRRSRPDEARPESVSPSPETPRRGSRLVARSGSSQQRNLWSRSRCPVLCARCASQCWTSPIITQPIPARLRTLEPEAAPAGAQRAIVVFLRRSHRMWSMNSRVVVDGATGERRSVRIVYPAEADASEGGVSCRASGCCAARPVDRAGDRWFRMGNGGSASRT
jgi:hypothetical protein